MKISKLDFKTILIRKLFNTAGLDIKKGEQYGFKIECPHSYIGLGKTVSSNSMPISINEQQWKLINMDTEGHS